MQVALFGLLLLAATNDAAAGQANPAAGSGGLTAAKPAKEKKICKPVSGSLSRIPKKICRTASEWDNAQQNGAEQSDLRRMGSN